MPAYSPPEDVFEKMRRERCEREWRQYQQDYTDYQTGNPNPFNRNPRQPFC